MVFHTCYTNKFVSLELGKKIDLRFWNLMNEINSRQRLSSAYSQKSTSSFTKYIYYCALFASFSWAILLAAKEENMGLNWEEN